MRDYADPTHPNNPAYEPDEWRHGNIHHEPQEGDEMGIITKEQADRLRQATEIVEGVEAELRDEHGDGNLYISGFRFLRSIGGGLYVTSADLVPADVEPVRGCGYDDNVKWRWEEHGVRIVRSLPMDKYLDEIGAADKLPKRVGSC